MSAAAPDLFAAYCHALRHHALLTVAEGYARMDAARYADAEEPAITGELVAQMRRFLESGEAPEWADRYSVHDDPPLDVPGRQGKRRPRVDVEVECLAPGRRPRLRFEAKRLKPSGNRAVSVYLGSEGLGCFLAGRYPLTHGEAGMLGYVQCDDKAIWADRIGQALAERAPEHAVLDPPFREETISGCPCRVHASRHRTGAGQEIDVCHVLLPFLPA